MRTDIFALRVECNKGCVFFNKKIAIFLGGENASILLMKDKNKYYVSPDGGKDGQSFNKHKYHHLIKNMSFVKDILKTRKVLENTASYIVSEKPIMKEGYTCYEITNKTAY